MIITEDTTFDPGTYILPGGITIAASGITLDGRGAILIGQGRAGRGVTVTGQQDVTIKNLGLREYYHGIYARQCQNLTISGCQITSTAEVAANTLFLDIWLPAEHAYGGAILLWEVTGAVIATNDVQHQMNGLLTYGCRELAVRDCLASYSSGFGFHLFATSDSLFEGNTADFCCRYQPRGEGWGHLGADATGFLIVSGSHRNAFRRNYARMGGDGFFLAGLNPRFEHVPCNDNLFEDNDGSYSPNNAFEATFSAGNIFRRNRANNCNYGFWLGFSRDNELEHNEAAHNRQAGIAVENGCGFRVSHNALTANSHGILLWSKHVPQFATVVPENDTSCDWLIEHNTFSHNGKAIRIAANQDHGIRPFAPAGVPPAPQPHHHRISRNAISHSDVAVELVGVAHTTLTDNQIVESRQELVEQSG
jgi:parallel beta-helix repeat protein